jgi:hypothetical protein
LLRDTSAWKGFGRIFDQTKRECGKKREDIIQLVFMIFEFNKSMTKYIGKGKKAHLNCLDSLAYSCYVELVRISTHILFLSDFGLYRNAFDNIRYALESIVQALYIDARHPQISIKTKVEILKEVEDKIEYHAIRLIDELKIENKDRLKKEYKALSQAIHPSHRQIVATWTDVEEGVGIPTRVDCQEIERIYDSMKTMYDIFFFLFLTYFPDLKDLLKKNTKFIECVQTYKLSLISQTIGLKLRTNTHIHDRSVNISKGKQHPKTSQNRTKKHS